MEAACQAVRLLLRLHHGARGTVQHDIATAALAAALSYCWVLPKEEGAGLIRHAKHWLVASADQHTARDWSCGHTGLVIALSRAGRPADAERLAAVLAAATCDGDHNELLGKAWAAGERALSIGESEGARRHFEALLALGRCRGMATVVRMALDGLGRCEGIEARIRVSIAK